jgi:gliding motility-associated-like protein
MTRLFILLPLFLQTVAFSQCSLEISDTTHVNCNGENTGAFSFNVTAAEPYSVSLSNGAVSMNGTSFANLNSGNYEAVLVDNNLCSDTVSIKIKEPQKLSSSLECIGSEIISNTDGGVEGYIHTWRNEEGQVISNSIAIMFDAKQFYDFEVTDSKGCSFRDTINVLADFTVNDSLGEFPFDVYITNLSSSVSFDWDFGDGNSSQVKDPIHTYESVGTYDLTLTVTDDNQCSDSKFVKIEVQGFEMMADEWQEMYNAFSPNGDGVNDNFSFLDNHAIVDFEMKVFNRWGTKVFAWTEPKYKWNGLSFNGSKLAPGVYYFFMNARGLNGNIYEKKGSVSIY